MVLDVTGCRNDSPVVEAFGSFLMDMFSIKSDLDLSVSFPNSSAELSRAKKIIALRKFSKKLYRLQSKGQVFGVIPILTARVPVLKVVDRVTGIECDISVDNKDGIVKSQLIFIVSQIDERFQKLSSLMKAWAKAYGINSSKDRTLNSLSITLLVAFHLQTREPPILPPFSALLKDGNDLDVVRIAVKEYLQYGKENKESLAELFVSLLSKMASVEILWPEGLCVSVYEGSWIAKTWNDKVGNISVEDFPDRSQNAARAVGTEELKVIYKCIHSSLHHLSAFMEGEIQSLKLKELIFSPPNENIMNPKGRVPPASKIPRDAIVAKKQRRRKKQKLAQGQSSLGNGDQGQSSLGDGDSTNGAIKPIPSEKPPVDPAVTKKQGQRKKQLLAQRLSSLGIGEQGQSSLGNGDSTNGAIKPIPSGKPPVDPAAVTKKQGQRKKQRLAQGLSSFVRGNDPTGFEVPQRLPNWVNGDNRHGAIQNHPPNKTAPIPPERSPYVLPGFVRESGTSRFEVPHDSMRIPLANGGHTYGAIQNHPHPHPHPHPNPNPNPITALVHPERPPFSHPGSVHRNGPTGFPRGYSDPAYGAIQNYPPPRPTPPETPPFGFHGNGNTGFQVPHGSIRPPFHPPNYTAFEGSLGFDRAQGWPPCPMYPIPHDNVHFNSWHARNEFPRHTTAPYYPQVPPSYPQGPPFYPQ